MLVRDVMNPNVISLSIKDRVGEYISLAEKHHIHEVFVLEKKKLKGMVTHRTLLKKEMVDPNKEKVGRIMEPPPATLKSDDTLEGAAKTLLKTGLRAVPVLDGKDVVGVISITDIVNAVMGMKEFRQTKAESIMSPAITVSDSSSIGAARALMRERNISRVPVIDRGGRLIGIVTIFDMLKNLRSHERMGWKSMGAEMERLMHIPITTVVNRSPTTSVRSSSLNDLAMTMLDQETSGVVISDRDMPIGVVTLKDLLEFYVGTLGKEGIYYQISGLHDQEEIDMAAELVEAMLKKVSAFAKVTFFFIHVKKSDIGYKLRARYDVRARLKTDKDIFISHANGWDVRDAVGQCVSNLEKIMLRDKEKRREGFWKRGIRLKEILGG